MPLLLCAIYVAAIGILSNPIAALLPRRWFHPDRFPFRGFAWEDGGKVYNKLRIRAWKDRVPDMSKFLKKLYRKQVDPKPNAQNLERLIQETCVAEAVHAVLMVLSLYVIRIWRGLPGWIVWGLGVLGNLPFIIIQRYNRPRLMKTLARLQSKTA